MDNKRVYLLSLLILAIVLLLFQSLLFRVLREHREERNVKFVEVNNKLDDIYTIMNQWELYEN